MTKFLKQGLFFLIVIFALLGLIAVLTEANLVLMQVNFFFFSLSSLFFIVSILLWLGAWSHLIKKHSKIRYRYLFKVGLDALYGSLTPVQLGSEAIRSIQLKEFFGV